MHEDLDSIDTSKGKITMGMVAQNHRRVLKVFQHFEKTST